MQTWHEELRPHHTGCTAPKVRGVRLPGNLKPIPRFIPRGTETPKMVQVASHPSSLSGQVAPLRRFDAARSTAGGTAVGSALRRVPGKVSDRQHRARGLEAL